MSFAAASTSATALKRQGSRKEAKHGGKNVLASTFGVSDSGLNRLNVQQVYALHHMFKTHPAVQAARSVLHAQLFSGGVQLIRDGVPRETVREGAAKQSNATGKRLQSKSADSAVDDEPPSRGGVTEEFARHLEEHWTDFAKDVCDSFLMWGVCAVVLDLEKEDPSKRAARLAKAEENISAPSKRPRSDDPVVAKRLVPIVPQLGTYEVGFEGVGRFCYTRNYHVYSQMPGQTLQVDEQAVVHVRDHPDSSGNCCSPLATVFELASFVHAITELAMTAEISRAQPSIVTQLRKQEKAQGLDPGALFFDSESRNVQAGQDHDESEGAARALEMQAQLMKIINQMQTTYRDSGPHGMSQTAFQPPDVPPKLFTLPKEHELAPHLQIPQPRGDLEALQRLSIDQVSAALGVPSSLIFEGKFSGKSTQQLQLLNSTVSQLAASINSVLTKTYNGIYPDETLAFDGSREEKSNGNVELKLRTSPIAASEELVALYQSQLIDTEVAVPAAMHALGCTSEQIEAAKKRILEKEQKQCDCEDEERAFQKKDRNIAFKEREVGLKKTEHDAKAPYTSASSGNGAASSSSASS